MTPPVALMDRSDCHWTQNRAKPHRYGIDVTTPFTGSPSSSTSTSIALTSTSTSASSTPTTSGTTSALLGVNCTCSWCPAHDRAPPLLCHEYQQWVSTNDIVLVGAQTDWQLNSSSIVVHSVIELGPPLTDDCKGDNGSALHVLDGHAHHTHLAIVSMRRGLHRLSVACVGLLWSSWVARTLSARVTGDWCQAAMYIAVYVAMSVVVSQMGKMVAQIVVEGASQAPSSAFDGIVRLIVGAEDDHQRLMATAVSIVRLIVGAEDKQQRFTTPRGQAGRQRRRRQRWLVLGRRRGPEWSIELYCDDDALGDSEEP